ncbi:hypothetical protein BDQ17DRAFT_403061 [Cyathus striatus]|nr:hypothetical protein BDQ17DRAFT_403061 [Cyathus striatus]
MNPGESSYNAFRFINPANLAEPNRLLRYLPSDNSKNLPLYARVTGCHIFGLAEQPSPSDVESLIELFMSREDTPEALAKASIHDKTKRPGVDPLHTDPNDWSVREWKKATRSLVQLWMGLTDKQIEIKRKALTEGKLHDSKTKTRLKNLETAKKTVQLRKW